MDWLNNLPTPNIGTIFIYLLAIAAGIFVYAVLKKLVISEDNVLDKIFKSFSGRKHWFVEMTLVLSNIVAAIVTASIAEETGELNPVLRALQHIIIALLGIPLGLGIGKQAKEAANAWGKFFKYEVEKGKRLRIAIAESLDVLGCFVGTGGAMLANFFIMLRYTGEQLKFWNTFFVEKQFVQAISDLRPSTFTECLMMLLHLFSIGYLTFVLSRDDAEEEMEVEEKERKFQEESDIAKFFAANISDPAKNKDFISQWFEQKSKIDKKVARAELSELMNNALKYRDIYHKVESIKRKKKFIKAEQSCYDKADQIIQ